MYIRRSILCAAINLSLAAALPAADSAETVLAGYGLRHDGGAWILPEHQRLNRLLRRFDGQVRAFHNTEAVWREEIERIEALEKQLQKLETQYEDSRRLFQQQPANPVVQQQLQEQRGQLSQRIGELRLVLRKRQDQEDSELYDAARRHAAARAELLSTAAATRQAYRRLADRNEALAASTTVQQALRDLRSSSGLAHELASADDHRPQVEATIRRATKVLETHELPLLLSGGEVHVDVLAGGRPATFVIDEDHPRTLIPLSHAERLGIPIDEGALWQALPHGERQVRLSAARIPALQIGGNTLHDVEVYVTDAAGADLGLRLGSDVLDRLRLTVDHGRARIEVSPSSGRDTRP